MSEKLSHIDKDGNPAMVDVGAKAITHRVAIAEAKMFLPDVVMKELEGEELVLAKGPVFQTAIIAGIMAAKKTGELIALCHPLGLDHCDVSVSVNDKNEITIQCKASVHGKTGIEMEALTGASIAALTVYDMCKALSHDIEITSVRLIEKSGGKRDFKRQ